EFFVRQIIRRRDFEVGATAKAPRGVDDFARKGLFERRVGREFGYVAGLELIKDVLLFRANEIRDRKQTKSGCVLRDSGAACGRDRAGGHFGVLPISQDLSGGSHGRATITRGSSGM